MPVTVVVEPDPGGHRFQYVRHVALAAAPHGGVVLLTSAGAGATAEFANYLGDVEGLEVDERLDGIRPPTKQLAEGIAAVARVRPVAVALVMDADQALKRWWAEAPRALRGVTRPRIVFLLTRYPARLSLGDRLGWLHRVAKGSLAALASVRGVLDRTVTLAGREDTAPGRLVKRVRDPAICTAHSRDRAALRAELGLPADRRLVGIFGVIDGRKNVPLVAAAARAAGADLVLGGAIAAQVTDELAATGLADRVHRRDGFLDNAELDKFVAAVDVVAIAQNNNGPSGIMGKALAAGVPVLSAGSVVRARELAVTGGGIPVDLDVDAVAEGVRRLLAGGQAAPRATAALAGPEEFAAVLLAGTAAGP